MLEIEEENSYDRNSKIRTLRELMKGDEKLKNLKSDDAYLERFLYAKNFCVEEAYKTMKIFYDLLEEYPEWFSLGIPTNKIVIDKNIGVLTKDYDKEGRLIYILKLINVNVNKMSLLDIVAVKDTILEASFMGGPTVCQKGLCVIIDIYNFPWSIMRWLTPTNIQMTLGRIMSMPIKEYRFHVVNNSVLVQAAIKIIWPFLPQEIKESVKFHFNDRNSLYEHIDKDVLPVEYGGKNYIDYEKFQSSIYDSQAELVESFRKNRICFLDKVVSLGDIKNK